MSVMLLPDTGNPMAPLPYPFFVEEDADGTIGRQDFWKGNPARVVGFVSDNARQEIDLPWEAVVADGDYDQVVGMYVVTASADGSFSTHNAPIGRVSTR